MNHRAFTLMELLLVIVMLSVIALLFVSYTGDVDNVAVDAASWKVQSDIRHAQQLATSGGVPHGVLFVRGGTYTVYRENTGSPIADPLDKSPMVEDLADFGSVAIGNNFQVEFDGMGRPVRGGGGYVDLVAENGASRRIYVINNTGAVTVDMVSYGFGCACRLQPITHRPPRHGF